MKTKADWKLERMLKEDFGANLDITSKGKSIVVKDSVGIEINGLQDGRQ
jgi:hypothetical protein